MSDKRPCGVPSQRNYRHAYRHLTASLVFAFPTHVMVTWYSHEFGRNPGRDRDSVLDRGSQFSPLHIFHTALGRSAPLQRLPGLSVRVTPADREADNPPISGI